MLIPLPAVTRCASIQYYLKYKHHSRSRWCGRRWNPQPRNTRTAPFLESSSTLTSTSPPLLHLEGLRQRGTWTNTNSMTLTWRLLDQVSNWHVYISTFYLVNMQCLLDIRTEAMVRYAKRACGQPVSQTHASELLDEGEDEVSSTGQGGPSGGSNADRVRITMPFLYSCSVYLMFAFLFQEEHAPRPAQLGYSGGKVRNHPRL